MGENRPYMIYGSYIVAEGGLECNVAIRRGLRLVTKELDEPLQYGSLDLLYPGLGLGVPGDVHNIAHHNNPYGRLPIVEGLRRIP